LIVKNNCALILGANSDIGWAIAKKLDTKGYELILAARNTEQLQSKLSTLDTRKVAAVPFDALSFDGHASWFDNLPMSPNLVICVFGYLGDQKKAEVNWQEAKRIIDTNYTGAASILGIVAKSFAEKKEGTIVGISSVAGDRGRASNYYYGSAKAAFTAFLSGLRNVLAKVNVHVLTVKPGFVATKMTAGMPLNPRLTSTPEQVADRVVSAIEKKNDEIYVGRIWWLVMLIIRSIPERIFKRLSL
jgi:short-subunit dehydrogenase